MVALNEPSLRKFLSRVEAGGWVLYNGAVLPDGCSRADVQTVIRDFTQLADELGDARAANIVMLGALLEVTGILSEDFILSALERIVRTRAGRKSTAGHSRGRELARRGGPHES